MKRLIFLFIAIFAVSKFCYRQTEGFAVNKLGTTFIEGGISEVPEPFFNSSYRYLGKGGQSYVFVSNDHRYVLKFFRSSKLNTLKTFYSLIPNKKLKEKIIKEKERIDKTLESYTLAYSNFKEESGLLAIHSAKSPAAYPLLKIIDKGQTTHTLDLNLYPFIIQEKALSVKEKISFLMENKEMDRLESVLTNLFSLIKKRIDKGIGDADPNLSKNFGFVEERAIQMDVGRFSKKAPLKSETLENSKKDLQHWINKNYPDLSQGFDRIFHAIFFHSRESE